MRSSLHRDVATRTTILLLAKPPGQSRCCPTFGRCAAWGIGDMASPLDGSS